MGNCAEKVAAEFKITREDQDAWCLETYRRAAEAWKSGAFTAETIPIIIKDPRKGDIVISEDEEHKKLLADKVPTLKPTFQKVGGTVTAANASSLNDGASAVIVSTKEKAEELGVKPLAKIIAFADAAGAPVDFPVAPAALAVPAVLKKAGLTVDDIAFWEFNEAFSVVPPASIRMLGLDPAKVNVNGGAVALGHALGSSGSRIVVTLTHLLKPGQYGCAAICNGGGGSSAIIIQGL